MELETRFVGRVLLPEIQVFFESAEGQMEYANLESKAGGRIAETGMTKV